MGVGRKREHTCAIVHARMQSSKSQPQYLPKRWRRRDTTGLVLCLYGYRSNRVLFKYSLLDNECTWEDLLATGYNPIFMHSLASLESFHHSMAFSCCNKCIQTEEESFSPWTFIIPEWQSGKDFAMSAEVTWWADGWGEAGAGTSQLTQSHLTTQLHLFQILYVAKNEFIPVPSIQVCMHPIKC